ncbi:Por secretion system C-terminal sorting domain [Chryseobacterium nakagawai]|uniref:T9SS C-terminal target domain-containing protein n=1 Tax=Chryseobacterium nakagawai TaxID=1241982 RepID=A0AAD0YP98_CHRNA|nr:T9SS type A sorting domain-containing protein [Chryseobacterium nakagawai]AZA91493.1 T9SS C-terminal target domain-containing protein [Chryseobacterium nakagawai]VEH23088.1 Por secretion system C-terminal sorting domain [Chryseobacterium nakagawai]
MIRDLYFAVRNLGIGILLMGGSALSAQQSCNNTNPGNNAGDLGCVTFTYQGQLVTYTTVRTADGKIWLQQNLGSERVAESIDDEQSYGDLFQWGRWDDGHQLRASSTTSVPAVNSPNGLEGGFFITGSPAWWSTNGLNDKWAGTGFSEVAESVGIDPCKAIGDGWRLPTQADWTDAIEVTGIHSPIKAYAGFLKLPMGGFRSSSNGGITSAGQKGYFWSSTPTGIGGKYLYIGTTITNASAGASRGQGSSVRCMKVESELGTSDLNLKKKTVEVFPNPVKGILTVKSTSVIEGIKIINAVGQSIMAPFSDNQINMNTLPSGLYMIELKLKNGESVVKKIMKD